MLQLEKNFDDKYTAIAPNRQNRKITGSILPIAVRRPGITINKNTQRLANTGKMAGGEYLISSVLLPSSSIQPECSVHSMISKKLVGIKNIVKGEISSSSFFRLGFKFNWTRIST